MLGFPKPKPKTKKMAMKDNTTIVHISSAGTIVNLDGPQHLNCLGEADIIEVEVDEASKAQHADNSPYVLDPGDKLLQVVRQNASHAPMAVEVDKGAEEVVDDGSLNKQRCRHDPHHGYGHCTLHLPVSGGHHHVTLAPLLLWCEGTAAGTKVVQGSSGG